MPASTHLPNLWLESWRRSFWPSSWHSARERQAGAQGWGSASIKSAAHPSLMETARMVLRELFYGETPAGRGGTTPSPQLPPETPDSTNALGGFPGVILWPETKPVVTLIAPLPALGSNPFLGHPQRPLSIPFGGEYWLFRWPFERPPSNSFFKRGTPSKMTFSFSDIRHGFCLNGSAPKAGSAHRHQVLQRHQLEIANARSISRDAVHRTGASRWPAGYCPCRSVWRLCPLDRGPT